MLWKFCEAHGDQQNYYIDTQQNKETLWIIILLLESGIYSHVKKIFISRSLNSLI